MILLLAAFFLGVRGGLISTFLATTQFDLNNEIKLVSSFVSEYETYQTNFRLIA